MYFRNYNTIYKDKGKINNENRRVEWSGNVE